MFVQTILNIVYRQTDSGKFIIALNDIQYKCKRGILVSCIEHDGLCDIDEEKSGRSFDKQ